VVETLYEVQRAILRVFELLAQDGNSLFEADVIFLAPAAPLTVLLDQARMFFCFNETKLTVIIQ